MPASYDFIVVGAGWTWPEVVPVFARIEAGPMRITRTAYPDDFSRRFVAAARESGIAANDDVSGPALEGAALSPVTVHDGQRWSTARGYLTGQRNLTVVTKADVVRVIMRDGRAVGVEYRRRGRIHQAFADHEVVVSAGVFGTPQLLQLSGVGPAEHLRAVGITPLVDSPRVGQGPRSCWGSAARTFCWIRGRDQTAPHVPRGVRYAPGS